MMSDYNKILFTLEAISVKIDEMVEIVENLKGSIKPQDLYEVRCKDEIAVEDAIK
tara:strand:+ start:2974 stop:3138 length:165 start_codon:yes stop_codon:yes gene_type:complete